MIQVEEKKKMKNEKLVKEEKKKRIREIMEIDSKSIYNMKCLHTGTRVLQVDCINTDGIQVSICVRHKHIGSQINNKVKKKKKEEKTSKKKQKVETRSHCSGPGCFDMKIVGSINNNTIVYRCDPGIKSILSYVDKDNTYSRFVSVEYHHKSHHRQNQLKLEKFKLKYGVSFLENYIKPSGVSSSEKYKEHVHSYLDVVDALNSFYSIKKVVRLNWDSYQMRQKTIDKMIHERFIKPANGEEVVIAMGAAAFSSCMKGNKPVPKNKLITALSKKTTVIMVDEFNTSQKCSCCHHQLKGMKNEGKIVYGVKQCMECCIDNSKPCNVTHNRDRNAAKNILYIFQHWLIHGKRPKIFSRKNSKIVEQMETLVEQQKFIVSSTDPSLLGET